MKKKNLNLKKLKVQSFVTSMDEPVEQTKGIKGGATDFYGGCGGGSGSGSGGTNTCQTNCNCSYTCYTNCYTDCCGTQDFYVCQ